MTGMSEGENRREGISEKATQESCPKLKGMSLQIPRVHQAPLRMDENRPTQTHHREISKTCDQRKYPNAFQHLVYVFYKR